MGVLAYYEYPSVLLIITLAGSVVTASLQYAQQRRLLSLASQRSLVPFVCKGFIRAMWARQLVPGDVIVVQPGSAVCDMVLLQGHALADESRLTGGVSPNATPCDPFTHPSDPTPCFSCTLHQRGTVT